MNSVERVKNICKQRRIPISRLEQDLNFSNGYISQLKKGVFPDSRLGQIADYLNLSVEYLMTGQEKTIEETYDLDPETVQIARTISQTDSLRLLFQATLAAEAEDILIARDLLLALNKRSLHRQK